MKDIKDQNSIRLFRRRISFLSGAMIFFECLTNVIFVIQKLICTIARPFLVPVGYEIFSSLTYGAAYALCFLIPALVLSLVLKEDLYPKDYRPKKNSRCAPFWVLLTLGMVYCCALVNGYIMNFFYNVFGQPNTELFETSFNGAHSVLLEVLTMAIIPGICEEVLFRGVFLKRLLPFGKNLAVVVSAVFFALMHQMPMQFFYTFCAGLMLGYLYVMSGSVWWGIAVHTLNNLLSVISDVFDQYLDERSATVLTFSLYTVLAVSALISLLVILRRKARPFRQRESVFGRTEPVPRTEGTMKIERRDAVRGFFTPMTIVFLCIYFLVTVVNFFSLYTVSR